MSHESSASQSTRPLDFALIALWFGLLTGLAEVALLAVKKFYLGASVKVGLDAVWMAPVADAGLFLIPGFVLMLLWLWKPSPRVLQVALAVFVFLAALGVLLLESQVALYAKAIVAAGVAVQLARLLARRHVAFLRIVRRTLPVMAAVVIVFGGGLQWWRGSRYQDAVKTLPAPPAQAPNVLFIVLDTVRAQSMSLYGYQRPTTPNLDRWAKSAAVFHQAIAPSPWTFPSHASMFTGRWPHELSADWHTPLDARHATLAEVLRDRGYLTAGFAANTFYCTAEFGMARGFLHYEDYPVSPSQAIVSSSLGRELISFSLNQDFSFKFRRLIGYEEIPGRKSAGEINDGFLAWLSDQDSARPFFAFLNYLDAHQPFLPPAPFDTMFSGDAPRGDPSHWWDRQWDAPAIQAETDAYDGAIAYIDQQLDRLFDQLLRRGQLDNTVVVITSDHGEHLGEHGFMRHGNTLYPEVLHVPLMVLFPKTITTAVAVREPVSLRDLPATILAMLGGGCERCLPGRPLMTAAGAPATLPASPTFAEITRGIRIPDRYPNSEADLKSLFSGNLHYIVNSDGVEELYDLATDPREANNLARSVEWAPALEQIRGQLRAVAGKAPAAGSPVSRN